nr:uncharacterized protein LOC101939937 [Chrysemys picta bellii]
MRQGTRGWCREADSPGPRSLWGTPSPPPSEVLASGKAGGILPQESSRLQRGGDGAGGEGPGSSLPHGRCLTGSPKSPADYGTGSRSIRTAGEGDRWSHQGGGVLRRRLRSVLSLLRVLAAAGDCPYPSCKTIDYRGGRGRETGSEESGGVSVIGESGYYGISCPRPPPARCRSRYLPPLPAAAESRLLRTEPLSEMTTSWREAARHFRFEEDTPPAPPPSRLLRRRPRPRLLYKPLPGDVMRFKEGRRPFLVGAQRCHSDRHLCGGHSSLLGGHHGLGQASASCQQDGHLGLKKAVTRLLLSSSS